LEIESSAGYRKGAMSSVNVGGRGKKFIHFEMQSKTQNGRKEFVNNIWPNVNEQIALRKILTDNNVTKLGNLGTDAYKIKRK
jgi:hypothetical protein